MHKQPQESVLVIRLHDRKPGINQISKHRRRPLPIGEARAIEDLLEITHVFAEGRLVLQRVHDLGKEGGVLLALDLGMADVGEELGHPWEVLGEEEGGETRCCLLHLF